MHVRVCDYKLDPSSNVASANLYQVSNLFLSHTHQMLEISACMETKAKSITAAESQDDNYAEISFEELLAQEKKDAFWYVVISELSSFVYFRIDMFRTDGVRLVFV